MECNKEQLIRKEQCYINIFQPYFNCSPTAGSCLGYHYSEEVKARRRKPHGPFSIEARKNMSLARIRDGIIPPSNKGKKCSEETLQKMRISAQNRPPISEETRNKFMRPCLEHVKEKIRKTLLERNKLIRECNE
jgi:hypothetical protein